MLNIKLRLSLEKQLFKPDTIQTPLLNAHFCHIKVGLTVMLRYYL